MGLATQMMKEVADLIRLGFPESTATKIASGELPMDTASRMQRAKEQGYDVDNIQYHGSTHDITEFDASLANPENDMGKGVYLTDSIFDANNNYAGEGPDLTNRIQTTAERIQDDLESNWSQNAEFWDKLPGGGGGKLADEIDALAEDGEYEKAAMMASRAINKGSSDGAVYPLIIKRDGVVNSSDIIEGRDYHTEAADDLGYDPSDLTDEQLDEVEELAYELRADDWDSVENQAQSVASQYGANDVYIEPDSTWNEVRDSFGVEMYNDEGDPVGSGNALADVLQMNGAKGYRDLASASRFSGMASGKHTIMFPGSENQIRSTNAAFDPDYKGPNLLGEYALPAGSTALMASLLAAPEQAEAGPLAKVISKTINRQDDANLPWSSEAQYTHDQSGGFMRLGVYPDGRVSTLELEVPEEFRRRGIGGELQESALRDYPEMQGQVSSKSALRNAYRLGRRPVEEPNATLERALEMQSQASSVNMKRPTSGERGAATPGMMALLAAGGAGATAAGSESNAVTEATSRIVNHMLDNVTEVTDLLEIPQRGIQGLLRAGYGLMQGDGLDASLNAGADVVNQGVEATARQAGDAMLEKTGNPELATMAYTAVMLGSPI